MESYRQALGAVFVAVCEAAGGDDVRRRANVILTDAVNSGAIEDRGARVAIRSLVHGNSLEFEDCDMAEAESNVFSFRANR
jgi:hypothetical protein